MNRIIYEPKGAAAEYAFLALNHYTGCLFGCSYCYVPGMPGVEADFRIKVEPRPDALERVRRDAGKYAGDARRVLLSFMSDPYPELEHSLELTRRILRVLRDCDVPFTILTKAGAVAQRDFGLYRPGVDAFGVTLTTLDPELAAKREPRAAPPAERIENLESAKAAGLSTWMSLEPVFSPREALEVMAATHRFVDVYKIGPLNHRPCSVTPEEWGRFARRAIDRCVAYRCRYFIKQALLSRAGRFDFHFENYDDRRVPGREPTVRPERQRSLW